MASCSGNGSRGHHKFTLNVNETYTSGGAENYSAVSWSLVLSPVTKGYDWNYSNSVPVKYNVVINGIYVANEAAIMQYDGSSTVTIASGTLNITHDNDGSKEISFSFNVWDNASASYLPGSASGSDKFTLTTIPRYAEIESFSIQRMGLNTAVLQYSVSKTANIYCSIDGQLWGNPRAEHTTFGTFEVSGLNPNQQHSFAILVRNVDSGLDRISETIYGTTLDIARISNLPNIEHGNDFITGITNPANIRDLNLAMSVNNTQILTRTVEVGNNTITFSDTELDDLYKKYGSSSSLTATFVLSGSGYIDNKTCTITLKGNQKTISTNVNNTWKRGKLWTNVNGAWKRGVLWTNVNGAWKRGI